MSPQTSKVYFAALIRSGIAPLQGALSNLRADDLLAQLLQALWLKGKTWGLDWRNEIKHFYLGCANQAGEEGRNLARQAWLLAGGHVQTYASTLNSLCTSGLEALIQAARLIALGEAQWVAVAAVEQMSRSPWVKHRFSQELADTTLGWRFVNPAYALRYVPYEMTETIDRLCLRLNISPKDQNAYAQQSLQAFENYTQTPAYAQELLAVQTPQGHIIDQDLIFQKQKQRPYPLSKLKPSTKWQGGVTLGNTARGGDGACLLILGSEQALKQAQQQPLAQLKTWTSLALHPEDLGLAAAQALEQLSQKIAQPLNQFQRIEISESFAGQVLACQQALKIPNEKLNPWGGNLACGAPLAVGCLRSLLSLVQQMAHQLSPQEVVFGAGAGLGLGLGLHLLGQGQWDWQD